MLLHTKKPSLSIRNATGKIAVKRVSEPIWDDVVVVLKGELDNLKAVMFTDVGHGRL